MSGVNPVDQLKAICYHCLELQFGDDEVFRRSAMEKKDACVIEICPDCPYKTELTLIVGNHPCHFKYGPTKYGVASLRLLSGCSHIRYSNDQCLNCEGWRLNIGFYTFWK